jgi:hypothetical protein
MLGLELQRSGEVLKNPAESVRMQVNLAAQELISTANSQLIKAFLQPIQVKTVTECRTGGSQHFTL